MYGFIGVGNMGSSIVNSFLACPNITTNKIVIYDNNQKQKDKIQKEQSLSNVADDLSGFLSYPLDYVFLCVKPNQAKEICTQIHHHFVQRLAKKQNSLPVVVSILAGVKIATLKKYLEISYLNVVRLMPNIATLIGQGCGGISFGAEISLEKKKKIYDLCNQIGHYLEIPETKMDAVTALSGSGPGFVYAFIESLIDGGVGIGLSRDEAKILVLQTILGATELAIKSNKHPAELKDMVTSPAGTTIAGIKALEKHNFRNAVISALDDAYQKSIKLRESPNV